MTRDDFRRQADLVRAIPLEVVLASWGAVRDRRDKSQWRTPRGPLSVTETKFYSWHACRGGGGAIDLVMHLGDMDAGAAIQWLQRNLGSAVMTASPTVDISAAAHAQPSSSCTLAADGARRPLRLPIPDPARLERVRQYLTEQRCLAADILNRLIDAGKTYADGRGNAVFLMVAGKANRPIGAELRGTGQRVWRGLAPGSSRNAGYFWVGVPGARKIILCESAIDAISCHQIHSECICISTAGTCPDAPWLDPLITRGYDIHCGFDTDEPGETASHRIIARHPTIQRLRPPAHDWNDAIITSRQ